MDLLDTDILTLFLAKHPQVVARVDKSSGIGTTVITQAEVLRARYEFLLKASDGSQLQRAQEWLTRTEEAFRAVPIVPADAAAAAQFDRLRDLKGLRRIGRADLLIASIALSRQATLVTRNLRHFRLVPGLRVENWADSP